MMGPVEPRPCLGPGLVISVKATASEIVNQTKDYLDVLYFIGCWRMCTDPNLQAVQVARSQVAGSTVALERRVLFGMAIASRGVETGIGVLMPFLQTRSQVAGCRLQGWSCKAGVARLELQGCKAAS